MIQINAIRGARHGALSVGQTVTVHTLTDRDKKAGLVVGQKAVIKGFTQAGTIVANLPQRKHYLLSVLQVDRKGA